MYSRRRVYMDVTVSTFTEWFVNFSFFIVIVFLLFFTPVSVYTFRTNQNAHTYEIKNAL